MSICAFFNLTLLPLTVHLSVPRHVFFFFFFFFLFFCRLEALLNASRQLAGWVVRKERGTDTNTQIHTSTAEKTLCWENSVAN